MPSLSDLRRQVDAIDRQIVELLSRRTLILKQIMTHVEGEGEDAERIAEILSNWLEEGIDFDLDEASLEKVCRAVMDMGKKAKDN